MSHHQSSVALEGNRHLGHVLARRTRRTLATLDRPGRRPPLGCGSSFASQVQVLRSSVALEGRRRHVLQSRPSPFIL